MKSSGVSCETKFGLLVFWGTQMVTTSTYYPSNSVVFGPGLEKLRGKLLRKFNNSVVVCDNLCVRTSGRIMFVCTLDGYV